MLLPIVEEVSILIQNKAAILKYLCHATYECKIIILSSNKSSGVLAPRKVDDPKTSDGDFDTAIKHLQYLRPGINLILNEPGPATDELRFKMLAETSHESLHLLYKFPVENGSYPYARITFVDLCLKDANKDEVGIINVSYSGCTDFHRVYLPYSVLRDNVMSRIANPENVKFTGLLDTEFFTLADVLASETETETETETAPKTEPEPL